MRYWGWLFLLLSGCGSTPDADSSLPWNRPADWELHRDITATTTFHKDYYPKTSQQR